MVHDDIPSSFFDDGWITDVESVVSSGKEGTVYVCFATERVPHDRLAVKIYTKREYRSFKQDSIYLTGRGAAVRLSDGRAKAGGMPDRRMQRAIAKKTRVGKLGQEFSWIAHEYSTLDLLHTAGAIVPQPFQVSERAILMEYIGDAEGPAPRLKDVTLTPLEARRHFRMLMEQIELWLANGRIHGDLSPFNILFWHDELKVIDFPQAVDPRENPDALWLLERDITNVLAYFSTYGITVNPARLAQDLWLQHVPW